MSNLRFTCTLSELRAVIVELVETFGCRFELETTSSAEPVILEAVERVMETIGVPDGGRGFHLTSHLWTTLPLVRHRRDRSDGRVEFYIEPRYGGPSFILMLFPSKRGSSLVSLLLFDYPYYFVGDQDIRHQTLDRPPTMLAAARRIRSMLGSGALRETDSQGRSLNSWLTLGAQQAMGKH